MPRTARASVGGVCYHVLNRGNGRIKVFRKDGDYHAFLKAIAHASIEIPMPVLGYCLMPKHFHLVVRPINDGDLSRWMHWLLNTHVHRYHQHYHTSGHICERKGVGTLFKKGPDTFSSLSGRTMEMVQPRLGC